MFIPSLFYNKENLMAEESGVNYNTHNTFCGVTASTIDYISDAKVYYQGRQTDLL